MLLPIGHDELRFNIYNPPVITLAIIVTCVITYAGTYNDLADTLSFDGLENVLELTEGDIDKLEELDTETLASLLSKPGIARKYGYVPDGENLLGLLTHQFLHADIWHLVGNMFFLFIVGVRFESLWSRPVYLAAFLLSGATAALVYGLFASSVNIPLIGASGSISGFIGAFLIRHPKTKIHFLWFFFYRAFYFALPAMLVLPLYFVSEVVKGFTNDHSNVAYMAHAGGFATGLLIALVVKLTQLEDRVEDGFFSLFRSRKGTTKNFGWGQGSVSKPEVSKPSKEQKQTTALPSRSSVPPDAALAMAHSNRNVYELTEIAVHDDHLEATFLINHSLNLTRDDATVVALGKLGAVSEAEFETHLPGIAQTEQDALLLALRLESKSENDPATGRILLIIDRPNPFDDKTSDVDLTRKIEWMKNSRKIMKTFSVSRSITQPQCSDGSSLVVFTNLEALLELINHV